jgi:hypothetical protein
MVRNESRAESVSLHSSNYSGYYRRDRIAALRLPHGSLDAGTSNGCGLFFVDFLGRARGMIIDWRELMVKFGLHRVARKTRREVVRIDTVEKVLPFH